MTAEGVTPPAQSDNSRVQILVAAAECFHQRGFAATSIDDVARLLGATKGRIYHHFSSKADLFAGVFRFGMEMNFDALEPIARHDGPPAERLCAMSDRHVRQMIETQSFQRVVWEGIELLMRGALTPQQRQECLRLQRDRKRYSEMFRKEMEAAKADGMLDYADISVATQIFFMAVNSPIFWYRPSLTKTEAEREAVIQQIVAFALHGLGYKGELQ